MIPTEDKFVGVVFSGESRGGTGVRMSGDDRMERWCDGNVEGNAGES